MTDLFQLIRDTTTPDRAESFCKSAQRILDTGTKNLVETGCYRGNINDGSSTIVLALIARAAGTNLHSYELDPTNIVRAKLQLSTMGLENLVEFHCGDSVTNLALRKEPIGFAYLDSYDCGMASHRASQEHQLAELECVLPLLETRATILLDDHIESTGGKTKLAARRLESRAFANLHYGYQLLYANDDSRMVRPSRFAVLCAHSPEYVPLAVHTIYRNFSVYCSEHGYDLRIERSIRPYYADPKSHAGGFSWSRMEAMLDLVKPCKFEWVWCLGADALITNMNITLEEIVDLASPDQHIIICGERQALVQADSFLVRGGYRGAELIGGILLTHKTHKHHPWVENQAMIDTLPFWKDIALLLPQHRLNSYQYNLYGQDVSKGKDCYGNRGNWEPGDFVVHWPGVPFTKRVELFGQYKSRVIGRTL